eukprot:TRINITY_DN8247_c0_g1_i1.p1 TRINITY_DN8247_c0_g1~~TRINITY_DN8247_c0_g1_i1.p1  ORF type:complete len:831 (+),score=189.49 TRINITY_DN8247_c0_g1_i1:110-2602(+)
MEIQKSIQNYLADFKRVLSDFGRNPSDIKKKLAELFNVAFGDSGDLDLLPVDLKPFPLQQIQRIFFEQQYSRVADFLLQNVLINWVPCFSSEEQSTLFFAFFTKADRFDSLCALISSLTSIDQAVIKQTLDLTAALTANDGISNFLRDATKKESASRKPSTSYAVSSQWEHAQTLLCSLPDRVANATKHQAPEQFLPSVYFRALIDQVIRSMCLGDVSSVLLSHLFSKLINLGHSDLLVENMFSIIDDREALAAASQVLENLSDSSVEKFFDSVLRRMAKTTVRGVPAANSPATYELLIKLLTRSETSRFILSNKMLLVRVYDTEVARTLVDCIFQFAKVQTEQILWNPLQVIISATKVWGDRAFVKHAALRQQEYITAAILRSLTYFTKEDIETSGLLTDFIQGVQTHIESPIIRIRQLGMLVGEAFSLIVSPNNPLKFDEAHEADEKLTADSISTEEKDATEAPIKPAPKRQKKPEKVEDDPDELLFKDDDDEEEVDEVDEDDLPAYDLRDDESDLSPKKTPKYLRDCLKGLRNTENIDLFEGSLNAIEPLVRSKPHDLDDLSESLASTLLHLEDRFSLPHFETARLKALVAVAVCSPDSVISYLTAQFYAQNYTLKQRLDVLATLENAAIEMSSIETAPEDQELTPAINDVVKHRIESNTRRWSKPRKRPKAQANRFLPFANKLFYPLLKEYSQSSNLFELMGSDAIILSKLVHTLAVFIECFGEAGGSERIAMCHHLIEFVAWIRFHEDSTVRQACLFALSRILLGFQADVLISEFIDEISDLDEWLRETLQNDSDANCRAFAGYIVAHVSQKIQDYQKNGRDRMI